MSKKSPTPRKAEAEYALVITCPDDILEESVVYQDIFQKGLWHGEQQGASTFALRLLERRFGKLSPKTRRQVERLSTKRIEELCEALLDFKAMAELAAWLKQNAAVR